MRTGAREDDVSDPFRRQDDEPVASGAAREAVLFTSRAADNRVGVAGLAPFHRAKRADDRGWNTPC
jgi:hypothetical protein